MMTHARMAEERNGRRRLPQDVKDEIDRRLIAAERPNCTRIAADLARDGFTVAKTSVWVRAQCLGIKLPSAGRGRPRGSKDTKPRKPRTNTLYSPHRDEVLRLFAAGMTNRAEIARKIGITPQWARQIVYELDPAELAKLQSVALKKKSAKRK